MCATAYTGQAGWPQRAVGGAQSEADGWQIDTYVFADVESVALAGSELLGDEAGSDLERIAVGSDRDRVLRVELPGRVLVAGAVGDRLADGRMRVRQDGRGGQHREER